MIVSLDIYKQNHPPLLKNVKPDVIKYPKFKKTEDKVEDLSEHIYKHRKYVGYLPGNEAREFLENYFDDTRLTMGSITFEGCLPAISFSDNNTFSLGYDLNAYVTPMLDIESEEKLLSELEGHPNAEKIKERVGFKLNQLLDALKKFKIGKSFSVNTQQLCLNL